MTDGGAERGGVRIKRRGVPMAKPLERRSCGECGNPFDPTNKSQLTCCGVCRSARSSRVRLERNRELRRKSQTAVPCVHCGKPFVKRDRNPCCSDACRKEKRMSYMRDYMRAANRKPCYQRVVAKKPMGVGPPRTVVCSECGKSVETRANSVKLTCSQKCSQGRMNRIIRERRLAAKEADIDHLPGGGIPSVDE